MALEVIVDKPAALTSRQSGLGLAGSLSRDPAGVPDSRMDPMEAEVDGAKTTARDYPSARMQSWITFSRNSADDINRQP